MSITGHPNTKVNDYILNSLGKVDGLNLVSCESKESIVLEEKEITWLYKFNTSGSEVDVILTVSDPIYFCNVAFAKSESDHFSLKPYLNEIVHSKELEDLFDEFIDEKVSDEDYTLKYLEVFKKHAATLEVQKIIAGEYWPEVSSEE